MEFTFSSVFSESAKRSGISVVVVLEIHPVECKSAIA
jgi:hypothetical protein